MFRAAHRSSSWALNYNCSLWFIYPFGDRPLSRLSGKFSEWKILWVEISLSGKFSEPSINFEIINSITKLHLVGISIGSSMMHGSMNIKIDLGTSWMRRPWPTGSCCAWNKTSLFLKTLKWYVEYVLPLIFHHHHHRHVHEGLGVFPVPWSSKWNWSLHLFLGRPMFLRPFGLYCNACFGILFVSILCMCCSHFSWYCFISFTMFCAPIFFPPNTLTLFFI